MSASNVAEIYNGIILDFYIGLPHFIVGIWTAYEVSRLWLDYVVCLLQASS